MYQNRVVWVLICFGQQLPYFRNIYSVLRTDNCQKLFAAWTATLAANYLDPPYFLSIVLLQKLPHPHSIKALIRSFVNQKRVRIDTIQYLLYPLDICFHCHCCAIFSHVLCFI